MKILALESSATAASAALCQDEALVAQTFLHTGLTHSQTLLPMVRDLLGACALTPEEVDLFAVAAGPGSFTGLRIGVATAKGLAWAAGKALRRLLHPGGHGLEPGGVLRPGVRRHGRPAAPDLQRPVPGGRGGPPPPHPRPGHRPGGPGGRAPGHPDPPAGGGGRAQLCYEALTTAGIPARLAPPNLRLQSAWGVAREGLELARAGQLLTPEQLVPHYHRLSQAERERLARERAQDK